jgi:exonuclease SbcC
MPLIEAYTKEIFDMFDLPYTDIELTDDFNVALFGSHGEESVDMLSGGERIASALALRIGIAKALSGSAMELIILDEPTIHLDSQRRRDLVEIIKKLSSIPQTIVVTHDKEFEQAADRLILVEKVRGISKVS